MTTTIDSKIIRLKYYFKSELARALLLDAHINLPALLKSSNGIWVKAVKKVKTDLTTGKLINSSTTAEEEYEMLKEIIALRDSSGMTDPSFRSGYIILCCKGMNDETTRKKILDGLGYDSYATFLNSVKPRTADSSFVPLTEAKAASSCYDFLGRPEIPV